MALLSALDDNQLNLNLSDCPDPKSLQRSDLDDAHFGWEFDLMLAKEEEQQGRVSVDCEWVGMMRREAVEWMIRVCNRYGFSGVSAALGVSYFDRFMSVGVQKGMAWMGQLAAVACLSLAAKMEEVDVPLLVDLQVEGAKYVFEAKIVQRMELLVLSGLKWKMNQVTPFSFLDHFIRRFELNRVHCEFLKMCERVIVSVIADSRSLSYPPSVLAAATLLCVVKEVEPDKALGYREQLSNVIKISKEKLGECYSLVSELSNDLVTKRKNDHSAPGSPHAVIDMSFSCENSNDSWVVSSAVSSPSEPPCKRRRLQEQHMRLRLPFNWSGSS